MNDIKSLMNLSGRNALIFGGAGHIGYTAAETLVELGCNVVLLDRHGDRCRDKVESLNQIREGSATFEICDLMNEVATRSVIRKIGEKLGYVNIVIHTPLYYEEEEYKGWVEDFEAQTSRTFERSLRLHLVSAFTVVQEARPFLKKQANSSVIFVSSHYGVVAPNMEIYKCTTMKNPAGYAAGKAGLQHFGKYLASILSPEIRVNCICPGGVYRNQPEVFVKNYSEKTLLGRMATETDLKGSFAFLASDLSSYVTGHDLIIDGGFTVC